MVCARDMGATMMVVWGDVEIEARELEEVCAAAGAF
jgi:hypothetical protein